MSYARLAERVYNVPLLILPDKAVTIEGVFSAHVQGRVDDLPKAQPDPRPEAADVFLTDNEVTADDL